MSKGCPNCGTKNRDEAKRCMSCNAVLSDRETPVRMCSANKHVMDPGWTTCPYCSEEAPNYGRSVNPTGMEVPAAAGGGRSPTVPEGPSSVRKPTTDENAGVLPPLPEPPVSKVQRHDKTRFASPVLQQADEPAVKGVSAPPVSEPGTRRIVAVLVTYTWRPGGQVFPVREGRNYLGRGPDCEICLPDDPQMSSRHATIIYRGAHFMIDDEKSMNGTFVNGVSVDEKQWLHNYSRVKTGATDWIFITVEPEVEK